MRRSLLMVNVVLLATAGLLGWRLRVEWKSHRSRVDWVYRTSPAEQVAAEASGATAPAAESWVEIVARNVFFPDRSSLTATGNAPPPEPILFGTLNVGSGPVALMSETAGRGFRQVRVGDSIGGYKLLVVEGQKVTLEWAGGRIKLDAAESASRVRAEVSPPASAPPMTAGPRTTTGSTGGVAVVSPSAPETGSAARPAPTSGGKSYFEEFPAMRRVMTREQIAELEREPPGTIRNGKIKKVLASPFGAQIYWEDLPAGESKEKK